MKHFIQKFAVNCWHLQNHEILRKITKYNEYTIIKFQGFSRISHDRNIKIV